MCLITKQIKPIILTEDLIVYKLLRPSGPNHASSVYFTNPTFEYEFNTLYKTEIAISSYPMTFDTVVSQHYGIDENHSRSVFKQELIDNDLVSYGKGFHFITDKNRFWTAWSSIYECVIPAGSEVYYDETGLGVANAIIVKHQSIN